jgi:hypothetical protein
MFEFSNSRFLVVGYDLDSRGSLSRNCPQPINKCARQISKIVYNKSAETALQFAQPSLSLCKLLPPCKPAKLVADQFLQGLSFCKILSYGVKRMAPSLTVLFVCHALFLCFTLTNVPPLFSFIFRTQRQTWPLKLLAPPSQAQCQRAHFFRLPCALSAFHPL